MIDISLVAVERIVSNNEVGHDRVVILTTDRFYLIPTLVAGLQVARDRTVADVADVIIFLIGMSRDEQLKLEGLFSVDRLRFIDMPDKLFDLPPGVSFTKSHVPITSLARLYTPAMLPGQYNHIIYLDGDTQIVGGLGPLVNANVPPGRILAANEKYYMSRTHFGYSGLMWKEALAYLGGIGIKNPKDYFSAGVLAADRAAWTDICGDALSYFFNNSHLCLFHDQSALNAVSIGRREILHPSYNFMTSYANVPKNGITPSVVHFTGSDKPWLFDDRLPWLNTYSQVYTEFLDKYPALMPYADHWPTQRQRLGPSTSRQERLIGKMFKLWLDISRRRRIRRHLSAVWWPPLSGTSGVGCAPSDC